MDINRLWGQSKIFRFFRNDIPLDLRELYFSYVLNFEARWLGKESFGPLIDAWPEHN